MVATKVSEATQLHPSRQLGSGQSNKWNHAHDIALLMAHIEG